MAENDPDGALSAGLVLLVLTVSGLVGSSAGGGVGVVTFIVGSLAANWVVEERRTRRRLQKEIDVYNRD